MAGIYIHIPYCRKACHYCNFHFSTSTQRLNEMVQAIGMEAKLRKDYLQEPVKTIYFGGGTPSLLPVQDIRWMTDSLRELFIVDNDAEITLESNPDDISTQTAAAWKAAGINRLSIGIQSFFQEHLNWMNRAHNAEQALESIQVVQAAGFDNITIDLIYGTPGLTDEKWHQNVQQALQLNIPHLSCYALTVEPKTALDKMIRQHQIANVDGNQQSHQFELLMQWMKDAGYRHYEISNFAKPGKFSRHNSSYWQGITYLGLGPSAHSFNGNSRQWNIANNALYLKSIQQQTVPFEIEYLTAAQQLNEYIMTGLRTSEGISLSYISENWGDENTAAIVKDAGKWVEGKKIHQQNRHLVLTNAGKLLADGIAADLFR